MKPIVKSGYVKKNFSYIFLTQNYLKQGDALPPLLFNFSSVYAIRNVKANQEGFKLNGTCRLLIFADEIALLGEEISLTEENTEAL